MEPGARRDPDSARFSAHVRLGLDMAGESRMSKAVGDLVSLPATSAPSDVPSMSDSLAACFRLTLGIFWPIHYTILRARSPGVGRFLRDGPLSRATVSRATSPDTTSRLVSPMPRMPRPLAAHMMENLRQYAELSHVGPASSPDAEPMSQPQPEMPDAPHGQSAIRTHFVDSTKRKSP
jgi:hypothetical protein